MRISCRVRVHLLNSLGRVALMDDMRGLQIGVLGDHAVEGVVDLAFYVDVILLQTRSGHDVFLLGNT